MALDLATLGLEVKSDKVVQATGDLDRFNKRAKQSNTVVDDYRGRMRGAERRTSQFNKTLVGTTATIGKATRVLGALGVGLSAAFAVRSITQFEDKMAEVSTLVDTSTFDLNRLKEAAIENSVAFGTMPERQASAFYQVISAGASTAAEAMETLDAANMLAVGGVTNIQTAADGLTSVLNAYGDQVKSATSVSDSMFVAMRAGKTTIGELSASLGQVAPIAASTGVSFDELTASVAALTKGGISTRQAVTGVRAILAAIAKPTSEATKMAEKLGLEFNSTALEAQGFQQFLVSVMEATGGSTDSLAQLFGGVEALVPVMALAGRAGDSFASILEDMANKAGATQEAFDKMAASPGFQAGRVWSALIAEATKFGAVAAPAVALSLKLIADNLWLVTEAVQFLTPAMLVVFGPTVLTMTMNLARAVGVSLFGAVSSLFTLIMANPLVALIAVMASLLVYFVDWEKVIQRLISAWGRFMEIWHTFWGNEAGVSRAIEIQVNAEEAANKLVETATKFKDQVVGGMNLGGDDAAAKLRDALADGGDDAGSKIADSMEKGAKSAATITEMEAMELHRKQQGITSRTFKDAFDDGGDLVYNAITGATRKIYNGFEDGGERVQGKMSEGGEDAGNRIAGKMVTAGKAVGGSIFADLANLGNVWSNSLQGFLGDLIIDQIRAQTKLLEAQAFEARMSGRKSLKDSRGGSSGSGGTSRFGGSSGGGGTSMSAALMPRRGTDEPGFVSQRGAINRQTLPANDGGGSNDNTQTTQGEQPKVEVVSVNVWDPQDMVNVMQTQAGKQAFVNFAKANRDELKQILGVA